jgi:NAD(P)-dependent dehydrogenase (short-subunit alcohol dehydrogenase family)
MALPTRKETKDGFEQQIGTNHIGHQYLTQLLLPKLKQVRRPRLLHVPGLLQSRGPGAGEPEPSGPGPMSPSLLPAAWASPCIIYVVLPPEQRSYTACNEVAQLEPTLGRLARN